jgi:hypothetical protein
VGLLSGRVFLLGVSDPSGMIPMRARGVRVCFLGPIIVTSMAGTRTTTVNEARPARLSSLLHRCYPVLQQRLLARVHGRRWGLVF